MLRTSNYYFLDALHFTLLYPNNTSFAFPRWYIRTASANISFIETNEQLTVYGAILRTFRGLFVNCSSFRSPNFSLAFLNYTHLFPIISIFPFRFKFIRNFADTFRNYLQFFGDFCSRIFREMTCSWTFLTIQGKQTFCVCEHWSWIIRDLKRSLNTFHI